MDRITKYNLAEYTIILLIICNTVGNQQPDFPSLIAVGTILLMMLMKIKFLGMLIGFVLQLGAVLLFIALISEASEYPAVDASFMALVAVGSCLTALVATCGTILVYKYGNHFFKNLIGD